MRSSLHKCRPCPSEPEQTLYIVMHILQMSGGWEYKETAHPLGGIVITSCLKFYSGGVWGYHRWAWRYTQPGWSLEAQLHNLHCVQVLVLPHPVSHLWNPRGAALGLPVCLHLLLPHLGRGALHQELSDRITVHQPHLLALHPDLLRSLLWGSGQDLQQRACGPAKRSLVLTVYVPYLLIYSRRCWRLTSPSIPPWYPHLPGSVEAQWQLQQKVRSLTALALLNGRAQGQEARLPPGRPLCPWLKQTFMAMILSKWNGRPFTAAPVDIRAYICQFGLYKPYRVFAMIAYFLSTKP